MCVILLKHLEKVDIRQNDCRRCEEKDHNEPDKVDHGPPNDKEATFAEQVLPQYLCGFD